MAIFAGEIRQILPHADPDHVEAWMRVGNPRIYHLAGPALRREIEVAGDALQHASAALTDWLLEAQRL